MADITFSSLVARRCPKRGNGCSEGPVVSSVDHSVAPLSDTRGGRRAALQRWRTFVESQGLRRYAKRRNDALGDGVSRMSAYLHYGFVAPFELVRWGIRPRSISMSLSSGGSWRGITAKQCPTITRQIAFLSGPPNRLPAMGKVNPPVLTGSNFGTVKRMTHFGIAVSGLFES